MRAFRPLLRVLPALLLVFFSARVSDAQRKADQIETLLQKYHDVRQFNGAALVAQGDDVLYAKGFGLANIDWGIPNAPNTRFRIGSVTKQFTAALILQLVEEGKIDLQGKIRDYLPAYPKPQGDRVTIHHLLTHTSGIPNYTSFPDFGEKLMRNPAEPDSFLTEFSSLELEFEPGTRWSYSNSGYFLLGVIVEKVTGMPYDLVLRKRLLDPLGLVDSGYDHYSDVVERRAEGYERIPGGYRRAAYLDTSLPYAAGMMYSTVEDLHTWARALLDGRPFRSPETLEKMITPHVQNYGYGIGIRMDSLGGRAVRVIEHGGGINGFTSWLGTFQDQGYTVVVLDNTSGNTGQVANAIVSLLFDMPPAQPKPSIADVLAEAIEDEGIEAGLARYDQLKKDRPDAYDFGEPELNHLGYHFLRLHDVETAIEVFKCNVSAYPNAYNTYDSLGEAYLEAGADSLAVYNYRKALELNPGSENAKRMLRRLGVEVEETRVVVPEGLLAHYVGGYELQPGFVITITREGTRLYVQATGQPRFEVFPMAQDKFFLKVVDAQLTFHADSNGEIESLTLHQNGQDMPAKKVE